MSPEELIDDLLRRARRTPEGDSGYNSDDWCKGRIEGYRLVLAEIGEQLPQNGRWVEPGAPLMELYSDGSVDHREGYDSPRRRE